MSMATVQYGSGASPEVDLVADVLVIGGGPAGVWAALAAVEDGCSVVVAEKGYLGTSGPFGIGANTGIYYIMPDDQQQRDAIVMARQPIAFGLSDPAWGYKVFDQTYAQLDLMARWGYEWPRNSQGKQYRGSLRGPTVMHFLREVLLKHGVTILDHSPALELLIADGVAAGARGVNKQTGEDWQVRSGSVVVATGGTAWLSGIAGGKTHTGDGYLMAAEAGAEFSGMEFSSQWHAAPAGNHLTRGAYREGMGTYYDNDGAPTQEGRKMVDAIVKTGQAWDQLDKTKDPVAQDLIRKTHAACFQLFERKGINPFEEKYKVSFLLEGTIRAAGGIAIDDDLQTTVPGLYAGGDVTSREKLTGAGPPGGGPASAWAFATGAFSGHSAAAFAKRFGKNIAGRKVEAVGGAGLRPTKGRSGLTAEEVINGVKGEMLPLEKNYWRTGELMRKSVATFDSLWKDVREGLAAPELNDARAKARAVAQAREAAALLAAGRYVYASALERTESRGLHRRSDFPDMDAKQDKQHVISGGVDEVWVKRRPWSPTLSLSQRLTA
jgi:succinate dehydrogenase/fumarate reductase flavoprotein subunit